MANTIALAALGTAGTTTLGGAYGFSNMDFQKPGNTVKLTITSDDASTSLAITGTREQVKAWLREMLQATP